MFEKLKLLGTTIQVMQKYGAKELWKIQLMLEFPLVDLFISSIVRSKLWLWYLFAKGHDLLIN